MLAFSQIPLLSAYNKKQKGVFMKGKILSFCLAFALIVPAICLFSACGDDETPKKQRTNTTEIVQVYQDASASVYVEVTGFEHTDYEYISNSGYNACTLEFSINDGEWFYTNLVQDFYDASGVGVYLILTPIYEQNEITSYNVVMTGQTISPGEISISVRIPESDTYYASAGSEKQNYTLKQYIQTTLDAEFMAGLHTLGSIGYSDTVEERYAFYQDSADPYKIGIGKFDSEATTEEESINGKFKYELKAITSEEENAMFAKLNLEYKVMNYDSTYINSLDGNESIDTLSIQSDENDSVYVTRDWTNVLNPNQTKLWSYESSGLEYESIVFLIRQKADENTVQSRAFVMKL